MSVGLEPGLGLAGEALLGAGFMNDLDGVPASPALGGSRGPDQYSTPTSDEQPSHAAGGGASEWQRVLDDNTGRYYIYNATTQESRWEV